VLKGEGPQDVTELTLELGSRLLVASGVQPDLNSARESLQQRIATGEALERLEEMVKSHGGDLREKRRIGLPHPVEAHESGYVSRINAERLGLAVIEMGGGRKQMGDELDHSTGIEFLVRIGDKINQGQTVANVFCDSKAAGYAVELVGASVSLSDNEVKPLELVVESIGVG
jgi:thymidine phosphorylase